MRQRARLREKVQGNPQLAGLGRKQRLIRIWRQAYRFALVQAITGKTGIIMTGHCLIHRLFGIIGLDDDLAAFGVPRSEEHTSELQSLMRISYAVFCLKKKNYTTS